MDISNRALVILLAVTLVLVVASAALTLGGRGRGDRSLSNANGSDLRIMPVVTRAGGGLPEKSHDPLVLTLREDTSAAAATLSCTLVEAQRAIVEGEVYWDQVPADGNCKVRLDATSAYAPVFRGDQLTCWIEGDATVCSGGLATMGAAYVSIASALPGVLDIDGKDYGHLPVVRIQLEVGKRELVVHLDDGRTLRWTLTVQPNEQIGVAFPSPDATMPTP